MSDHDASKADVYFTRGKLCFRLFQLRRKTEDLDNCIRALEQGKTIATDSHPDYPDCEFALGSALKIRFQLHSTMSDLDSCICSFQRAVEFAPETHANKPIFLPALGFECIQRFQTTGNVADLDLAIQSYQHLHTVLPLDRQPPDTLYRLGYALLRRFEHRGDPADLDAAIISHRSAAESPSNSRTGKATYLRSLADCLVVRFEYFGDVNDLDEAISALRGIIESVNESPLVLAGCLCSYGNALFLRFQRFRSRDDIEEAADVQKRAIALSPDSFSGKHSYLTNLGNTLVARFGQYGDINDLDDAIALQHRAIDLLPDTGLIHKPVYFANLANSLSSRFGRSKQLIDIDTAISLLTQVIDMTPNARKDKPAHIFTLGNAYLLRFGWLDDLKDLENAIMCYRRAVGLVADNDPTKALYLGHLGGSLYRRFNRGGGREHIEEAIAVGNRAVSLTPQDHPLLANYLSHLGYSYMIRFDSYGEQTDIEKSVFCHRQAVERTINEGTDKASYLNGLGLALSHSFQHSKEARDINESIDVFQRAIKLVPAEHPGNLIFMGHLGSAFKYRLEAFGDPDDRDMAMDAFRTAFSDSRSKNGDLSFYRQTCRAWAGLVLRSSPETLAESFAAWESLVDLIPRTAWLGRTISERHGQVSAIGEDVRRAAAIATLCGRYTEAVEWLEQGRAVIWGQQLNLRAPVDELMLKEPELAQELTRVAAELDAVSTRVDQEWSLETAEGAAQRNRRLAEEWEELTKKTRAIPGFENFLQPKRLPELQKATRSGHIVLLNVAMQNCSALVLSPDSKEVMHVPLPRLSYQLAETLKNNLRSVLDASHTRARSSRPYIPGARKDGNLAHILSIIWKTIVKPVLDRLGFEVSKSDVDTLPRICWCPTGPLAFLPIHAAGLYDQPVRGYTTSDFVISSYTPTLSTLIPTSEPPVSGQRTPSILAVGQRNTPSLGSLPHTGDEIMKIRDNANGFQVHVLEDEDATVDRVREGMTKNNWLHLACHALQMSNSPLRSAFYLHDGSLTLEELITKTASHTEFAFLSACQTSTGDEDLSEEAVHLAAGMQLAGYRSVIATMWSIKDEDGPVVADGVYSRLLLPKPDSTRAALALHCAVKRLREDTKPKQLNDAWFLRWVPFIHMGV
ncbi:hypothetical protein DENSPDRAFT_778023 [Dentipellis sp. KUC8613]|nr:hypothetical protein DENSPDRAFT_778023 [Dentipellis sp. KUC8613]